MGHLIGTGAREDRDFPGRLDPAAGNVRGHANEIEGLGEPKPIISEEIDTTAIAARDVLSVRGKGPVVAQDPKVCTQTR